MSRTEFTKATRLAAWRRCKGHCEGCGEIVIDAPHEYDHSIPCAFTSDNSLSNVVVLCIACHRKKTDKDIKAIAKSNRIRKRWEEHKIAMERK